jgi:alpha-amylase/alpha-mannosidase (GH57 family)
MAEVAIAFFWHQHQPYYPDDVGGENPMPWVRLHGVKDYLGMALHLLACPPMRCTINLVPSLVKQILAYTERGATDRPLQVSRIPADGLSENDCLYLLDHFFMAQPENMIRPHPRYHELYQRRGFGRNSAKEALRRFAQKDFRDLQCWFNLAWIHELVIERDAGLHGLRQKDRGFSEAEKNALLDKHLDLMREILPAHRQLAANGQVELTTTPYYHPILPLLFDKKLAREAMPDIKLPRYAGGYPEDAAVQVRRAIEQHASLFGKRPTGLWPAEGSVCQPMLPLLAQNGIRWIATDEEILSHSLPHALERDNHGRLRHPERLYQPYKVREAGHELGVVFRDHALSDSIGFHYQRSDPVSAAEDFVLHLHNIGAALNSAGAALVSVTLDGENCWEHYPGGGVTFLRELYKRCTSTPGIHPTTISEFLEKHPPAAELPHLFAGSWISHNFAIWIGHEEDNTAWDALHRAREHLVQRGQTAVASVEKLQQAWEELYIAEGSDWFWWYGEDHTSAQDALFDYLFRKHLQNVYAILGDTPPADLARPISKRGQRPLHSMPRGFLDVKIDGRMTYFEWVHAGAYIARNERGTMAQATPGAIRQVLFGFDLETLFLRVDLQGRAAAALAPYSALRIGFLQPGSWEVQVTWPKGQPALAEVRREGRTAAGQMSVEVGLDKILEIAIPFDVLGVQVGGGVQFFVELMDAGQARDRAPREGAIHLTRPGPDFERRMWDV